MNDLARNYYAMFQEEFEGIIGAPEPRPRYYINIPRQHGRSAAVDLLTRLYRIADQEADEAGEAAPLSGRAVRPGGVGADAYREFERARVQAIIDDLLA